MQIDKDVRLMIAVPTLGSIHTELVARLLQWQSKFPPNQVALYLSLNVAPVDRARNGIVQAFLAQKLDGKPLTHLLMIDSDTVPQADAPFRLLAHDLPFVSGMTPIANRNKETGELEFYDNCFESVVKDNDGKVSKTNIAQRGTGLRQILRCGAACLLVKRHVFESMTPPFFRFEMDETGTKHTRSEDIYFCDIVKDNGYVLYADTDVVCQHNKQLSF
jgi:hypothetical protein